MAGEHASDQQKAASRAQSRADRGLTNKQAASQEQSDADRAAVPKHGL